MQPERRRAVRRLRWAIDLFWMELKVVTGGRRLVLGLVLSAWFIALAAIHHFSQDPWDTASLYNWLLVIPGAIQGIALAMGAFTGERETRQLEVTFATPSGRYRVWVFRLLVLLGVGFATVQALSLLTWLVIDGDHAPFAAAAHAAVPVALVTCLTAFGSVAFKSSAMGGLVSAGALILGWLFHAAEVRYEPWFNPYSPWFGVEDPAAWQRIVVHNRACLLTLVALFAAGALALLQRRERLL